MAKRRPKNVAENLMMGSGPAGGGKQQVSSSRQTKSNQAARFSPALAAAMPKGNANQVKKRKRMY